MLVYVGHIELPVCHWMGKNQDYKYKPEMRTYNIADILEVSPIPPNNVYPPRWDDRCEVRLSTERVYCFLSYQKVCELINAKIRSFVLSEKER